MMPKKINRSRFTAVMISADSNLRGQIFALTVRLTELASMKCAADNAEAEGMRVTYYESEDSVYFTSQSKGDCGFIHGGTDEADAQEASA
jgi:hypothetical protein